MKSGIDFFPLDVTLDNKLELIEAEFGLTGFGVIVHLLQEIYGKSGYYIEWTNEVALLFAKKVGLGGSVVSEIIEASIRRGMFDKEIYDKYHVLTSRGIQKRYFEAVSRRKEIEVDDNILLVNVTLFCKNADIMRKNVNILSENVDISKQSKVEKSKVKKSKVEKAPELSELFSDSLTKAVEDWIAYKEEKRQPYKPTGLNALISQIKNAANKHGDSAVIDVIRQSMAANYQGILFAKLEDKKQTREVKPPVAHNTTNTSSSEMERLRKLRESICGGSL